MNLHQKRAADACRVRMDRFVIYFVYAHVDSASRYTKINDGEVRVCVRDYLLVGLERILILRSCCSVQVLRCRTTALASVTIFGSQRLPSIVSNRACTLHHVDHVSNLSNKAARTKHATTESPAACTSFGLLYPRCKIHLELNTLNSGEWYPTSHQSRYVPAKFFVDLLTLNRGSPAPASCT